MKAQNFVLEGWFAFHKGLTRNEHPHKPNTIARARWELGWDRAAANPQHQTPDEVEGAEQEITLGLFDIDINHKVKLLEVVEVKTTDPKELLGILNKHVDGVKQWRIANQD